MAVSNGARRHSLFKTYHGREMAAGAMLSEETSPPVCFLLKPEAGVMPRFDSQNPHPRDWRILYRVAIFERDSRVIEKGLSDAEDAIVWRTRELYQETGAAVETERGALDDANYALEA